MICDFIFLNTDSKVPLWKQIYQGFAEAHERLVIETSEKLPSVRVLSKTLGISRSPVETAYIHLQLDGFIESKPKSGYFVLKRLKKIKTVSYQSQLDSKNIIVYDLSGKSIDAKTADITAWRRHLRASLNMQDKILSEGDPQGEKELREALMKYCFEARKVRATTDQIVISSGTQHLLTELCRMMDKKGVVAIESPGYEQGERIFQDFGWKVEHIGNAGELIGKKFQNKEYNIFADITSNRPQMSLSNISRRRKELLDWVSENDSYILEDDYNGELRYFSRPIPSLQGAYPEKVIYIGSFSRLLLPSVRIAYMVVPDSLAETAKIKSSLYDQTSSKVEQLALAGYIKDGQLERHIRRSRKTYQKKSKEMMSVLKEVFKSKAHYKLMEASLFVVMKFKSKADVALLIKSALSKGVEVDTVFCAEDGCYVANISFSTIEFEKIKPAVEALFTAWSAFII